MRTFGSSNSPWPVTSIGMLVLTALLAGCGGARTRPGGSSGAPAQVGERAAYELRCASDAVQIERIADNTYVARGCGAETVYACMGGMGQYACQRDGEIRGVLADTNPNATPPPASGAPVDDIVRPRATHDLSCAEIEVLQIASLTYAARGCGAEIVYACMGAMGNYQCQRDE